MIRAALLLAMLAVVTFAARAFAPEDAMTGGVVMAFGFLLVAAILVGHVSHDLHLPHLTGYLVTGALFGPELLGLITRPMLAELTLVKQIAVAMIALLAGCELNLRALRSRLRQVGALAVAGCLAAAVLLFGFFLVATQFLPFAAEMTLGQRAVVALIAAVVLAALSPAVVIGIVSEMRSAGPLTTLALAVVVAADLIIVLLFTGTESVAALVFPGGGGGGLWSLAVHIFGSLGLGLALGALLSVYVDRVGRKISLFVFGMFFVVAEIGGALHLDPLLIGLAVGLFVENASSVGGERVVREVEAATIPTFAVFFAVAGAEVRLGEFFSVAGWALGAAGLRAVGLFLGSRLGSRVGGVEPALRPHVLYAMLPQAGVAIALALLVQSRFPPWGPSLATLLLGTIIVNEMVGPLLWRLALVRAGEVGQRPMQVTPAHAPRSRQNTDPPPSRKP